ncbi:hypothetical protein [Ligilactobacillus agilis]
MTSVELKLINKLATSQYNEAVLVTRVEELQAKVNELQAKLDKTKKEGK